MTDGLQRPNPDRYSAGMTDSSSQATYQVRLGWGEQALTQLATADIFVIVDAIGDARDLAAKARALPHGPAVFIGSLRNRAATGRAVYDEQLVRGQRTAINLVLAGENGGFAVEDYLAAGAIGDTLTALGLDHSAPDLAVATEGFRALTRALKHLLSASATGLELTQAGRRNEVKAAAELDAEAAAVRF